MTPEALIHFCHKRLCLRAQENIRAIAEKMRHEVYRYNPRFSLELVPQCHHLLWCPEGKQGCGGYPSKEELREKLFKMENDE
jgi:thymidylate synthase (FAD)